MRVVVTAAAELDLIEIGEHIAIEESIDIVHVLHGARDYESLLFLEGEGSGETAES